MSDDNIIIPTKKQCDKCTKERSLSSPSQSTVATNTYRCIVPASPLKSPRLFLPSEPAIGKAPDLDHNEPIVSGADPNV